MRKSSTTVVAAVLTGSLIVGGCSHDQTLSKSDEKTLKHNFTRALTAEEVGHMNSAPAAGADKGKK